MHTCNAACLHYTYYGRLQAARTRHALTASSSLLFLLHLRNPAQPPNSPTPHVTKPVRYCPAFQTTTDAPLLLRSQTPHRHHWYTLLHRADFYATRQANHNGDDSPVVSSRGGLAWRGPLPLLASWAGCCRPRCSWPLDAKQQGRQGVAVKSAAQQDEAKATTAK
jgi:hypothetical protein